MTNEIKKSIKELLVSKAVYPDFIKKGEIYAEDIEEAICQYLEKLGWDRNELESSRFTYEDGKFGWSTTKCLKIKWEETNNG